MSSREPLGLGNDSNSTGLPSRPCGRLSATWATAPNECTKRADAPGNAVGGRRSWATKVTSDTKPRLPGKDLASGSTKEGRWRRGAGSWLAAAWAGEGGRMM